MYSEERSEKSTGTTAPRAAPALADADGGAGEELQHLVDVAVRQHVAHVALETGVLEDMEGAGETVRRIGHPGREQVPAVGGHRQVRVMGAIPHESEQRQHAGPRTEARGKGATPCGSTFEPLQQAVQPVALVVERVVARQQLARLREQDHHEPHRHPACGAVDVLRGSRPGTSRHHRTELRRTRPPATSSRSAPR